MKKEVVADWIDEVAETCIKFWVGIPLVALYILGAALVGLTFPIWILPYLLWRKAAPMTARFCCCGGFLNKRG